MSEIYSAAAQLAATTSTALRRYSRTHRTRRTEAANYGEFFQAPQLMIKEAVITRTLSRYTSVGSLGHGIELMSAGHYPANNKTTDVGCGGDAL